jgi:hypothetical protein
MMTLFGMSIDAVWPWFLVAAPLALGLLIYIFRAKGTAQPTVTSTLFLLRALPSYLPQRKRFIPPLQFWLELLAFLLLALAASGLFMTQTGERIAVVIDTSLSMSAHQSSPETRLQTAKRIASADISQSDSTTRFALFSADSVLTPHTAQGLTSSRYVSARAARALLEEIPQRYRADRLQTVVTPLLNSREYDRLWIYTDKATESTPVSDNVRIISIPVDQGAQSNLWIDSIAVKDSSAGVPNDSNSYLQLTISSSGQTSIPATVSAECVAANGNETFSLPAISVNVQPGSPKTTRLGPLTRPWEYCHVTTKVSTTQIPDLISNDNEVWITHPHSDPQTLTVHSSLTPRELGLQTLPYAVSTPNPDPTKRAELYSLYHRQVPQQLPPTNAALLVFPIAGQKLWGGGAVAASPTRQSAATITRWVESHPVLQYVQPTLLVLPQAVSLTCPETATPLLFTAQGPVLCAGEESGVRYIITGFELFPFDGLKSPTVSILTLNALRWLFNPTGGASQATSDLALAQVGTITLPYEITQARMVAPTPKVLSEKPTRVLTSDTPGIISMTRMATNDSAQTLLAVNALSRQESDIARIDTVTLSYEQGASTSPASLRLKNDEKQTLESVLITALLVILSLDLLRRIITRSRWGGAV